MDSRRCLHHVLIIYGLIFTSATTLDLPPIPQPCDAIKCPPESEMQCPDDSSIRENLNAVDLIKGPSISSLGLTTEQNAVSAFNTSLIPDELYAQCCLSKKCVCKTCYIPDCDADANEVVVEVEPESMDTPGQCCGRHECMREPNCTEVRDTDYYWLQRCQRCHCTSGAPICHQSCDEGAEGDEEHSAFCESKNLNTFFKDGNTWKDGCYECMCVKGESKCMIPFCGNVNCPSERQVLLKDSCCPVCWPKGYEMGYDKEEAHEVMEPVNSTPHTSSRSTNAELVVPPKPCPAVVAPSLRDFPNVVEVRPQTYNDLGIIIIIFLLLCVIVSLLIYIRHLRAKQRSYRPVSNFDDKV